MNGRIPLVWQGKVWDLAFLDDSGEVVLVEIMRTYRKIEEFKR